MSKGSKAIVIILIVLMVLVVGTAVSVGVAKHMTSPIRDVLGSMENNDDDNDVNVSDDDSDKSDDEKEESHYQKVLFSFEDGSMIVRFVDECSCGEETVLKNKSTTEASALNILEAVACDCGLTLVDGDDEEKISRKEITQMIQEYEFSGDTSN